MGAAYAEQQSSLLEVVYPAILSQVAKTFKRRVQLDTHTKDLLAYNDCFIGKDAVVSI